MAQPQSGAPARRASPVYLGLALLLLLFFLPQWFWGDLHFPRQIIFWLSVMALMLFTLLYGYGSTGLWRGALIDERGRMSLSRFQVLLWTWLILPALSVAAVTNVTPRKSEAAKTAFQAEKSAAILKAQEAKSKLDQTAAELRLKAEAARKKAAASQADADQKRKAAPAGATPDAAVAAAAQTAAADAKAAEEAEKSAAAALAPAKEAAVMLEAAQKETPVDPIPTIPPELWVLLGISLTSLVASPLLLTPKKETAPAPGAFERGVNRMELAGDPSATAVGVLNARDNPADARAGDLATGEELANAGYVDVSRLQNLYFTLILALVYAAILHQAFAGDAFIHALPALSAGMVTLVGISHAGYLAAKSVQKTPDTTATSGAAGGGAARGVERDPLNPGATPVNVASAPKLTDLRVSGTPASRVATVYGEGIGETSGQQVLLVGSDGTRELVPATSLRLGKIQFQVPDPPPPAPVKVWVDTGTQTSINFLTLPG
jgi:hypothetical protein